MWRPTGVIARMLAVGVAVSVLLNGCAEDSDSQQPPAPSNVLVAESLFQAIVSDTSSHDLFFGAFMIGDSLFAGNEDRLDCFTAALTEELERTGPEPTLARLAVWAQSSQTGERDTLVEVLNDSSLEERLDIGSAANVAIERCGGLLATVLIAHEGPSYTSCVIEAADSAGIRDLFVAASIEMNGNERAEATAETSALMAQHTMPDLSVCVEQLEDARAAWAATSTAESLPGAECGQPGNGYGYIQVDQEWYTSARSVNTNPETSYHARVWGARETWITGDGTGRDHQVTNGPGFDSFNDADAWLQMGAREPLETGILTYDEQDQKSIVRLLDLPCLARLDDEEAQAALDLLTSPNDAFSAVLNELRYRGSMPEKARQFAVEVIENLRGVTRDNEAVDSLGRPAFRLWAIAQSPAGATERHEALFEPSTNRILEYLEIAVDQPGWSPRPAPFVIRRETVLADGQVESTQDWPAGFDAVSDPHRPTASMPEDQLIWKLAPDFTCDQLIDQGASYSEVVAYWVIHDKPTKIDLDQDGMPCDDDYDERSVEAFWPEPPS